MDSAVGQIEIFTKKAANLFWLYFGCSQINWGKKQGGNCMFWLQLPSLTLSISPRLPTSLRQHVEVVAAEAHRMVRKWVGGTWCPHLLPGFLGVICSYPNLGSLSAQHGAAYSSEQEPRDLSFPISPRHFQKDLAAWDEQIGAYALEEMTCLQNITQITAVELVSLVWGKCGDLRESQMFSLYIQNVAESNLKYASVHAGAVWACDACVAWCAQAS